MILGIFDIFIGLFTGDWEQMWNGIKGIFVGVRDTGVADKIKSFLHFSMLDEGPLTDFESWMSDFMDTLDITKY